MWAGSGGAPALTGRGITVAVIDSGIDTRHNALAAARARDDGLHRRRRLRSVRPRHARGGDHRRAGRPDRPRRASYRGIAPGAYLVNLRVLGRRRLRRRSSDVIEAIDWAIEHRQRIQHRGHQPVARRAGAAAVSRRSAVRGGGARGARRASSSWRRRATTGGRPDGRRCSAAITSPGNSPYALTVGAIDTHGTPRAVGRHAGGVQLAGADAVRPGDEAGPGGAGQPHRVGGGGRVVSGAGRIPSGTWPATGANGYMQLSGTSMAAAVVSGAVALLLEERPQPDAGGGEGGAAADEHVHAVGGVARRRRGEHERAGGGRLRGQRICAAAGHDHRRRTDWGEQYDQCEPGLPAVRRRTGSRSAALRLSSGATRSSPQPPSKRRASVWRTASRVTEHASVWVDIDLDDGVRSPRRQLLTAGRTRVYDSHQSSRRSPACRRERSAREAVPLRSQLYSRRVDMPNGARLSCGDAGPLDEAHRRDGSCRWPRRRRSPVRPRPTVRRARPLPRRRCRPAGRPTPTPQYGFGVSYPEEFGIVPETAAPPSGAVARVRFQEKELLSSDFVDREPARFMVEVFSGTRRRR